MSKLYFRSVCSFLLVLIIYGVCASVHVRLHWSNLLFLFCILKLSLI